MMGTYASSQRTKDVLINATGELAAEFGFSNITTRAIARHAKVNVASIHYHFGGKEQLFEAVIREIAKDWKKHPIENLLEPFESRIHEPAVQSRIVRAIVHRNINIMLCKGHPKTVFLGTGQSGLAELTEEGKKYLDEHGVDVETLATPEIIEAFNKCEKTKAALLHVTC